MYAWKLWPSWNTFIGLQGSNESWSARIKNLLDYYGVCWFCLLCCFTDRVKLTVVVVSPISENSRNLLYLFDRRHNLYCNFGSVLEELMVVSLTLLVLSGHSIRPIFHLTCTVTLYRNWHYMKSLLYLLYLRYTIYLIFPLNLACLVCLVCLAHRCYQANCDGGRHTMRYCMDSIDVNTSSEYEAKLLVCSKVISLTIVFDVCHETASAVALPIPLPPIRNANNRYLFAKQLRFYHSKHQINSVSSKWLHCATV